MKKFETKDMFETKSFDQKPKGKGKSKIEDDISIENTSLEEFAEHELNEYEQAYKEAKQKEQKQIKDAISSGYWFAAYFADTEQCQEFLKNAGLQHLMEAQYIRGDMMAEKLGVKVTKKKMKVPPTFKRHKDFTDMCM